MKTQLYAFVGLIGVCAIAQADTIFQTSFEGPAYSNGQLNGQNGWLGSLDAVVETATVHSGLQAVGFNADSVPPNAQDFSGQPLSYDSSGNPQQIVQIRDYVLLSSTGATSFWDALNILGTGGFIAQLLVLTNNTAVLGLSNQERGSIPVSRGVWNSFEIDLNFQTQQETAFVNGQLLAQGPFSFHSDGLGELDIGRNVNAAPGSDQAFFDDVTVASTSTVPEPSTFVYVTSAILVVFAIRFLGAALKVRFLH